MNWHPFASLAFLSGLPAAPGGAGQSGPGAALWPHPPSGQGALWPHPPSGNGALWPHPPSGHGALWPIEPDAMAALSALAALWPHPPRANAALWPIEPDKLQPPSGAAEGLVRVEPRSLLNEALRKSRVKVVRESDSPDRPSKAQGAQRPPSLWRWAPDSRIKTVSCELMQRFMVAERSVWVLHPASTARPIRLTVKPQRIFELPATLSAKQWQVQVDKVIRAAVEREDRLPEILTQASDFGPFFESITGIHFERAPRLAELMAVVQDAAVHLVMLLKEVAAEKRPVERSSRVMPVIATPGHGSLPSGHATLAALTSELLHLLMYRDGGNPQRSMHLDRLARRIAFNRVVAGVHFPVDSQVGYGLGTQLARWFAALADNQLPPPEPLLADQVIGGDLDLSELPDGGARGRPPAAKRPKAGADRPALVPTWRTLWAETVAELRRLRV